MFFVHGLLTLLCPRAPLLEGGVAPGVVRGLVLAAEQAAKTAAAGGDAQVTLVTPKARGRPPTPGGKNALKRYLYTYLHSVLGHDADVHLFGGSAEPE